MYMTFRQMKADPARLQDALGLMEFVVGRLNDEHGGSFGYSMQVGGDPSLVALSSPWETLGRYQAMREAIATDPELQSAIRLASDLFTDAQDMIGKVLNPPGERGAFVEINTARIHMPAVAEAMAFCQEVVKKHFLNPYRRSKKSWHFWVKGPLPEIKPEAIACWK